MIRDTGLNFTSRTMYLVNEIRKNIYGRPNVWGNKKLIQSLFQNMKAKYHPLYTSVKGRH
jgi:hypothetical protein